MALSPSAAWVAAVERDGYRPVFLIKIYNGTTTWSCLTASADSTSDLASAVVGAMSVSPVGVQLDPMTRSVQADEVHVEVLDEWIRPIVVNNRLERQRVTITIGAAELNEADFVAYFVGAIEEIVPRCNGVVDLVVRSQLSLLETTDITGNYVGKHPLQVLYDGTGNGLLEKGGVTSFTTASFDPTDTAYDSIEHYLVTRSHVTGRSASHGIESPTPARGLVEEILRLLNGHLVISEDGACKFVPFVSATAASDTWTTDDFLPDSFEQEFTAGNITNRLTCNFGRGDTNIYLQSYQADETASQSAYKYPGATERIVAEQFNCDWLDRCNFLAASMAASGSDLVTTGSGGSALSGNKTGLTIDASHPVYLLIVSTNEYGVNRSEIVKATGMTRSTTVYENLWGYDPSTYALTNYGKWPSVTIASASLARGQLGTTATAHAAQSRVYDITILVNLFDALLARFAYGCHTIRCSTNLTKYRYQVGDMISVTFPRFLAYGLDGLSATKFEVVGKIVDVFSSPPKIDWVLASATENAVTRTGRSSFPKIDSSDLGYNELISGVVVQPSVESGFALTDGGGLVVNVAGGIATNG